MKAIKKITLIYLTQEDLEEKLTIPSQIARMMETM